MIRWSATKINVANYCNMRYYLNYIDVDKPKPLRLSAYVRGSLLHDLIEKFWTRLGTQEEATKKSGKKKYYDAESFAKYSKGKWLGIIFADDALRTKYEEIIKTDNNEAEKMKNHLIYWRNEDEKWTIKNGLPKVAVPLFNHLKSEGPPLFSELPFKFNINNRMFTGYIDEVRKENGKIIIRDYKSGKPWVGDMKSRFDPQLTMYNVGLSALSRFDSRLSEKLGLEASLTNKFLGNPIFVNPDFKVEFFMIDALGIDATNPKIRNIPPPIVQSERKEQHFYELIKMIESTEERVKKGDFNAERGRKCDDCDVKVTCAEKLEQVKTGTLVDKKDKQIYFTFAAPFFMTEDESLPPKQKKIRFRKPKIQKD